MTEWLDAGLAYAGTWLDYQIRLVGQPGCVVAAAKKGVVIYDRAFGTSNLRTGEPVTPLHRFRVASHSKTFTAVGIMKLREEGCLHLDDEVGKYVGHLDPGLAEASIAQLLSHASGIMRDGRRSAHWQATAPFFGDEQLRAELARPLVLDANTRFKYSNLGFGALGLAIEAITGEPYGQWIVREVVAASGLQNTFPDMPIADAGPIAFGHSGRQPFGRGIIEGHAPTFSLAAATGFVSTANDLARFFASLDPKAESSVLSVASRREMIRRHWHTSQGDKVWHNGLGTMISQVGERTLIGHGGSFPGFISRSVMIPEWEISLSILTNAVDGSAPGMGRWGRFDPGPVQPQRSTGPKSCRLDRPMVVPLGTGRFRADRRQSPCRRSFSCQSARR